MTHIKSRTLQNMALLFTLYTGITASQGLFAADFEMPDKLKVCADPYMLPFSNNEEQGYENKIAKLFAKEMGLELEYTWFPQRMGFVRNTLKKEVSSSSGKYACDLIMDVPSDFELAATTKPYYTTSYVLVFARGHGLDGLTDANNLGDYARKNKPDLKFGLADRGPQQIWVVYQDLIGNIVPFQGMPGDVKVHPGKKMIDSIVSGDIDAAIVWGPTAGYYAKQYSDEADLVLLHLPDQDRRNRELKFTYSMSMAVRYGENEWKQKINQLIDENRDEIHKILTEYGVPLVEKSTTEETTTDSE